MSETIAMNIFRVIYQSKYVTCSWSILFVTAERRADSVASGKADSEGRREGEDDLRAKEEP